MSGFSPSRRGLDEGVCPAREDETHCVCWWDGVSVDEPAESEAFQDCCACRWNTSEGEIESLLDFGGEA